MFYTEIITDSLSNRGNIIQLPDSMLNIHLDYYGKQVTEGYHSAFLHTEDFAEYKHSDGSKRGYDEEVYSKCLYWDFDSDDISKAQDDVEELMRRLGRYSPQNRQVFFSGGKGFHVIYACPELEAIENAPNIHLTIKGVCTELAKGLTTFDNKVYDKTRVIRTPNSIHGKTGYYKVPVWGHLTIDELYKWASTQQEWVSSYHPDWDTQHDGLIKIIVEQVGKGDTSVKESKNFQGSDLMNGIINGFSEGQRNTGLASVAGLLHSRGFDQFGTLAICHAVNKAGGNPISDFELENIVRSVEKYDVAAQYTDPKMDDIVSMIQAKDEWHRIITKYGHCSFGERFPHINKRMKLCIPGDLIGVVANSGSGKSTVGMELGNNEAAERDMFSLFGSLEMSKAGVFFRAATIESEPVVENKVDTSQLAKRLLSDQEFNERVCDTWKSLLVVDKGGLSVDKLMQYFRLAQEKTGGKVSNLVIDYAQNLRGAEEISYAMKMARQLKEVAKELETKVFVLMQCNKALDNSYTQVQKNHIEGAGAYFQACDYIIGMWRSSDRKDRLHCEFIKDRWGDTDYKFDLVREGLKYHSEDYLEDRR